MRQGWVSLRAGPACRFSLAVGDVSRKLVWLARSVGRGSVECASFVRDWQACAGCGMVDHCNENDGEKYPADGATIGTPIVPSQAIFNVTWDFDSETSLWDDGAPT